MFLAPWTLNSIHFIDGFTLGMKFQSIVCLLRGRENLYCILNLEGKVHSIVRDLWTNGLQKCNDNFF